MVSDAEVKQEKMDPEYGDHSLERMFPKEGGLSIPPPPPPPLGCVLLKLSVFHTCSP